MESLNRVESCGIIGGNRDRSASINNRNPLAPQTPINRYKCIRFKLDSTSILDGEGWAAMYSRDRTWITETGGIHLLFIFQSIISKDTMITRDNFYSFLIDIHVISTMRIFLDDAFSFLLSSTLFPSCRWLIESVFFFSFRGIFAAFFQRIAITLIETVARTRGVVMATMNISGRHPLPLFPIPKFVFLQSWI